MLHDHKDGLSKDEQNAVGVFMTSLKLCGHRCIPPNAPHKQDLLKAIKEVNLRNGSLNFLRSKRLNYLHFFCTALFVQEKLKYEAEEKTSKVAWEKKIVNTQKR